MTPISAIVPTTPHSHSLEKTLHRLAACQPPPAEILVHVDGPPPEWIAGRFPQVKVLTSSGKTGPGGARNRLLREATHAWVASFDDDSSPLDADFFARASDAVEQQREASVIACALFERDEEPAAAQPPPPAFHPCLDFVHCSCLWRRDAFLSTRGHVPLAEAWCMEEQDVGLQLFAQGGKVVFAPHLRVFHDTARAHHNEPRIAAATLANVALLVFLRYPLLLWPLGFLQIARRIAWMTQNGRVGGILPGLCMIPARCWKNRRHRETLPVRSLWRQLILKRRLRPVPHGPGLL